MFQPLIFSSPSKKRWEINPPIRSWHKWSPKVDHIPFGRSSPLAKVGETSKGQPFPSISKQRFWNKNIDIQIIYGYIPISWPFSCKNPCCSWNNGTGSTTDSLWFSEMPKEDRLTTGRSVPGNDDKQQKSLRGKGASISEASAKSTQPTCGENICFWQITFQPTILQPRLKALTWPGKVIVFLNGWQFISRRTKLYTWASINKDTLNLAKSATTSKIDTLF